MALYRNDDGGGVWKAVDLHVPTWLDGRMAALHAFLDPTFVTLFDLPTTVAGPARSAA